MITAAFHTLGCRVNAYETEAMAEQLRRNGYRIVPFSEKADVYIVNTCTVTSIADRKSRQMLHRAREMNPDALVVAAGCYAVDAGEALLEDEAVDLVVGNSAKHCLADILARHAAGEPAALYGGDMAAETDYEPLYITETEGRTRAFLKIQDGCNQFCTYCRIPYVRGRVRSRAAEEVVSEARRLSDAGYRELILTGIHLSSYGLDLDDPGTNRQTPYAREAATNIRLLGLIRDVAALPGVRRLRFGSLEPGIMTEEFVRELSGIPEVCPQFHLSLQSGCDATLERMRRRYDTASYELICGRIREAFPDAAITTDVIAGFPGETEEEFAETEAYVRRIAFAGLHVFKYSGRKGTAAAGMKDQVPEAVRKRRSAVLGKLAGELRARYAGRFHGRSVSILFEECRGADVYAGHTAEGLEASCRSEEDLSGRILDCRVLTVNRKGALLVAPPPILE